MELLQLIVLLVPMFILMALGMPLFLSMGVTCLLTAFIYDLPLMIIAKSFVTGLSSYDFLALPFYFLAGDLMNQGGVTVRLLHFSSRLIGGIKGGLSHVNIIASMIFSGVSGSAAADTSAIGSVLIPAMKKEGYPAAYSAAVTAASSIIGPIVPPSIPLVVYGLLAHQSVGQLFLAGAVPGLMMGFYLLITSFAISHRRAFPTSRPAPGRSLISSLANALSAMMMPVIILVGITSGLFTATEAGVIAVAYGFILGVFVYREIKLSDIPRILGQAMINTGTILIIIATTGLFSWIIANMGLDKVLTDFFVGLSDNKWIILAVLNLFFLIWGCFLDPLTAMIILVPVLIPLTQQYGIDLIHFGVVVVLNLMIGLVTPPIGLLLFLTSSMAETRLESVIKEMIPFLLALLLVLVLCTFLPEVVLWLPKQFAD